MSRQAVVALLLLSLAVSVSSTRRYGTSALRSALFEKLLPLFALPRSPGGSAAAAAAPRLTALTSVPMMRQSYRTVNICSLASCKRCYRQAVRDAIGMHESVATPSLGCCRLTQAWGNLGASPCFVPGTTTLKPNCKMCADYYNDGTCNWYSERYDCGGCPPDQDGKPKCQMCTNSNGHIHFCCTTQ